MRNSWEDLCRRGEERRSSGRTHQGVRTNRAKEGELRDGVQVMKSKRKTTICASEKLCQKVLFLALALATARTNHGDANENAFDQEKQWNENHFHFIGFRF